MKRGSLILIAVFLCLLMVWVATPGQAQKKGVKVAKVDQHPTLSQQQKLIPCSQCHREVTPQVYKEWYSSLHGLDNVKCFQCHGTFQDFHVTPPIMKCEACHAQQVEKMRVKKACWECHPAHGFKEHK